MGSLKGQSANELLVIYMFVMLIFTIFIASFAQQRSAEMESSKVAQADSIGEQFASDLNLAARSGSGYSKKIIYPVLIGGLTPYTIILNNISKSIDIKFNLGTANYSHSFPIITSSVVVRPEIDAILPNGTAYGYILQSSNQSFSTGYVYVQNLNGGIVISLSPLLAPNPAKIVMGLAGNYTRQGTEFANVTANVTDSFGSIVPDGTLVHFSTSTGTIDDFAPTVGGNATANLAIQTTARVTASISGVSQYYTVSFTSG